jgi:uncharacterized protein YecE (DUF72 family)
MPEVRIGISGWRYAPWRGTFYPQDWPQKHELDFASRRVNSIEINGSFYSLQRPSSYRRWHDQTPEGFVFAVKCPRFITHIKRLKGVQLPLANFFASGVLGLNQKLGPLLWQLPPFFPYDRERLAQFFELLPRSTGEAAALARRHDNHLKTRAWLKIDEDRPLRHSLEVRHNSFIDDDFIALLRKHDIALVVADTAGKWPFMEDITSDFIYVRLHGDEQLYVSGYTNEALDAWAEKIRGWTAGRNPRTAKTVAGLAPSKKGGRDVYVYFDNDVKVRAPFDAQSLVHKLGLGPPPEEAPPIHSIDELPRTVWPAYARPKRRKVVPA